MFTNRFLLIISILSLLLVSLALAGRLSIPDTDYFQRHPYLRLAVGNSVDTTDYFFRHPEAKSLDLTDYFLRHPELRSGLTVSIDIASDHAPLDECFDVSLSEVAACREASQ